MNDFNLTIHFRAGSKYQAECGEMLLKLVGEMMSEALNRNHKNNSASYALEKDNESIAP